MIVTISGPARKTCPYKDEDDQGTAVITFDLPDGVDAAELHDLAALLKTGEKTSHEQFTASLFDLPHVTRVVTTWHTAGLEVRCVVPGEPDSHAGGA